MGEDEVHSQNDTSTDYINQTTMSTPRFEFVSSPEEISTLMERARTKKDDGSLVLDAEAMFQILEVVHADIENKN